MKFKIAITGLLAAILTVCIITSYVLINEAKKQTQLQLSQAEGIIAIAEYAHWYEDLNIGSDFNSSGDTYLEEATKLWHEIRYPEQHKKN